MLYYERKIYLLMIICALGIMILGIASDGLIPSLQGFLKLQTHGARLINDFTVVGGVGGALLNTGLMGLLALILIKFCDISLSGPTIAALFTIVGFSLFGKTPLNTLPIILGVFIASKVSGKSFSSYILFALFGTALGPLVSYTIIEAGFTGIYGLVLGILFGAIAGFILPGLGNGNATNARRF